jgi:iron complex outermembrane recepter protein
MRFVRVALSIGALALVSGPVSAQDAQDAPVDGAADLPEVEVIQETAVQKAVRKKKAVPVSPLSTGSSSASTSTAATTAASTAATSQTVGGPATLKVPSAVSTVTDSDIARDGTGQIQQVLQQQVPGIIISDAAGNPMRAEISFRGFDASPVTGRSQGLAVYQNGIRINEAFGDTVNWDIMPSNAISAMSVVSNNPSFGLNALGGAVSIRMKDGFSYQGGEIDIMGGSFGRRQIGFQAGGSVGNAAAYFAVEGIKEDGFRDFSESDVQRFYGDIGLKGSMAELHFSLTAAQNEYGATAAAPVELLARDWSNTFTSPQTQDLEVFMPTISANLQATKTLTLSGAGYYRSYKNKVVDGNVTEIEDCQLGANTGLLCVDPGADEEVVQDLDGTDLIAANFAEPLGSIERLDTESESWGVALEGQEKARLLGLPNLLIAGLSYDHGKSNYKTSSELGQIQPKYVVNGSGVIIQDEEGDTSPRDTDAENTYWGLYFSNALDVTDQLTVTVGGRYNYARIKLTDNTGDYPDLNATNTYERFNPMAGANYRVMPGLSVFGGYSESSRAPTPAELGCAEPEAPCFVEGFLTDDPPLDQVVGRTGEIGVRGQGGFNGGQVTWSAGLFRTLASDDILPITDDAGRVYFINAGDTLRQGVELAATYQSSNWNLYGSYAFVDATLDTCVEPSGECAFLEAGDRLPGIPRHRFKAGIEYWLTSKWKIGADVIAASNQPFYPSEVSDDLGIDEKLAGYTRVDLHTTYDVNDNIQIYGLVKNLFDREYGLYGTYFEADEVTDVDTALGGAGFNDSRTISPAQPFAAYGGVRVKF